jgi:hypothetical protein
MDKSDTQELLAALYLRLNGYFLTGFIAHDSIGNRTEMDVLGVRFPGHREPEREIACCEHLRTLSDKTNFIVGEVKGGSKRLTFNRAFWGRAESVESVLNRRFPR